MKSNSSSLKASTTSELPEGEAIRLAQEGDSNGFERLYQLHCRRVYGLCLHMVKNPTEAEDLTQDAFLQTFRKIHTFRGDSRFSTWLHRLTANIVLMRLRKRKYPEISLEDTLRPSEESPKPIVDFGGPDLLLSGAIDRIDLEKVIERLPAGYKQMLILHDVEGYEHNEIAQILCRSVGNSKSQLHKARRRLRELLPMRLATANDAHRSPPPSLSGGKQDLNTLDSAGLRKGLQEGKIPLAGYPKRSKQQRRLVALSAASET